MVLGHLVMITFIARVLAIDTVFNAQNGVIVCGVQNGNKIINGVNEGKLSEREKAEYDEFLRKSRQWTADVKQSVATSLPWSQTLSDGDPSTSRADPFSAASAQNAVAGRLASYVSDQIAGPTQGILGGVPAARTIFNADALGAAIDKSVSGMADATILGTRFTRDSGTGEEKGNFNSFSAQRLIRNAVIPHFPALPSFCPRESSPDLPVLSDAPMVPTKLNFPATSDAFSVVPPLNNYSHIQSPSIYSYVQLCCIFVLLIL
ncbi:hypothetical protein AB6A40_005004 [Gnathostoma spinigerum]|uniref:Pepsin inhibitor-3-like repeated domain-containing protein n=1 Tax=Gnathostoma spinigerum TaxID=75299 RepID=A0ABD6EFB4_9BILA